MATTTILFFDIQIGIHLHLSHSTLASRKRGKRLAMHLIFDILLHGSCDTSSNAIAPDAVQVRKYKVFVLIRVRSQKRSMH